MLELTPRQRLLCEEILGNISEDGYLSATPEQILESVEPMAALEQSASPTNRTTTSRSTSTTTTSRRRRPTATAPALPPGVDARSRTAGVRGGARRWSRRSIRPASARATCASACCFSSRTPATPTSLTYRLVDEAFPDLIAHRWNDLARKFGVEPREVQTAADALARLDPKPGLKYSAQGDAYIMPDLIVDKIDGRYHVFLNDTGVPRLRLSPRLPGDRARPEEDDRRRTASSSRRG